MKSLLFTPGNREDRFLKALHSNSNFMILDLEDSVSDDDKYLARVNIKNFVTANDVKNKIFIRINSYKSKHFEDDTTLLFSIRNHIKGVILSKCENIKSINSLREFKIIPMIESAKGIKNIHKIAKQENVIAMTFGALDLIKSLNMSKNGFGPNEIDSVSYLLNYTRVQLVLASNINKLLPPIECIYPNLKDLEGLEKSLILAKNMGFGGALCIHPNQVPTTNKAFEYTKKEIKWAKEVLKLAAKNKNNAFQYENEMIDLPLINKAKEILK